MFNPIKIFREWKRKREERRLRKAIHEMVQAVIKIEITTRLAMETAINCSRMLSRPSGGIVKPASAGAEVVRDTIGLHRSRGGGELDELVVPLEGNKAMSDMVATKNGGEFVIPLEGGRVMEGFAKRIMADRKFKAEDGAIEVKFDNGVKI